MSIYYPDSQIILGPVVIPDYPDLYRVLDDIHSPRWGYAPRQVGLKTPPMVNTMLVNTNEAHGTTRTPLDIYGWDEYFMFLNGDKWEQAASSTLAMFNHSGWPQMESIMFGCNLIRAKQAVIDGETKNGWAELITLDYYAGPPIHYPTYYDDPVAVQKFTMVGADQGNVFSRELFYPVVCKQPTYMRWAWLKPVSSEMVTPPPP